MTTPTRALQPLIAAALLALLASCATPPGEQATSPEQTQARAESAHDSGNYARAGELYDAAAAAFEEDAPSSQASLAAGRSWLQAGEAEAAAASLARIVPEALDEAGRIRLTLARAELALKRGEPGSAAALLQGVSDPPASALSDYLRLRAETAQAQERPLAAVTHRVALAEHLETSAERADNRDQIWAILNQAPAAQLQQAEPGEGVAGGWIRLAQIARSHRLDPQRLEAALEAWESTYPQHPALERQVPALLTRFQEHARRPERLALLLPLSGDFRDAGRAVRDGILLGHFNQAGKRPSITVYDTGGDAEQAREALAQAREEGCEAVIGPLTREAVAAVAAAQGDASEPTTLALNRLRGEDSPGEAFYQFGLSPETEARQAARYAYRRGWREIVVLAPRTDWGERVAEAFQDALDEARGTVLHREGYDPADTDFSGPIREALNLRNAEHRYQELADTLGEPLEYRARRRQDVDAVFLIAYPENARLLKPQLAYHHAQDVPVLATSHAYSGVERPERDQDLNGLRFLAGPWLLGRSLGVPDGLARERLDEQLSGVMARHARLVALGIDAYRVLPYLSILSSYPEERLEGVTGTLRMDAQRTLKRGLAVAQFVDGRPVLEEDATEGEHEPAAKADE
ncbi:MAG: penicillin-binding protein activator [Halorhodospira sp.]